MKTRDENLPDTDIVALAFDVNALRKVRGLADKKHRDMQGLRYAVADIVGIERHKGPFSEETEEVWEVYLFLDEMLRRAEAIQKAQRTPISI